MNNKMVHQNIRVGRAAVYITTKRCAGDELYEKVRLSIVEVLYSNGHHIMIKRDLLEEAYREDGH